MAVQYVKFPLSEAAYGALRAASAELSLGVEHDAYRAEVVLGAATLESLREDLS